MGTQRLDFAEFYRRSRDKCLRTVLVSVGDQNTAQDLVDEAFARACASWRTVSRHPAPAAWVVRTALNANISRFRDLFHVKNNPCHAYRGGQGQLLKVVRR